MKPTESLKTRALTALAAEVPEGEICSYFSNNGGFLLVSDVADLNDKGSELFLEYPQAQVQPETFDMSVELYSKGRRLLTGIWSTELQVDGTPLVPTGLWETLCEDFNDDYAFCERSIPISGGRRFSRRVFFAYHEALLLLFDEIDGTFDDRAAAPQWNYRSSFPFDASLTLQTDADAREIILRRFEGDATSTKQTSAKRRFPVASLSESEQLLNELEQAQRKADRLADFKDVARLFPLNLPEWRDDVSFGDLRILDDQQTLELTTFRRGGSLTTAFLFDLNSRRASRPCAWRPLTVGEKMRVVAEDDALGRKIKLGQEQFVLYASTSPRPEIRSILGRNLLSDFMFGKFVSSRGVVPILDVETID